MRRTVFRVLAGAVGLLALFAVILEVKMQLGSGSRPSWVATITMLVWSTFFLWFAFTGRPWAGSYERDILDEDEEPFDR